MPRRIFFSLAFGSLIIIAAVFVFTDRKTTIRRGQMNVALEKPSLVDKIVIRNEITRIVIEKDNDKWRLNGKYTARKETVQMFLQALGRIEVLSPASRSIRDSIIRKLEEMGIQVVLYQGNKVLKSMRVYYERKSIPGTYMMDEYIRKPYLTGLTGYNGDNIENLFSLREAGWKDNILFDYNTDEIASVEIDYPRQPERSFRITCDAEQFPRLQPLSIDTSSGFINLEEIKDYLSFFSAVYYALPAGKDFDQGCLMDPFAVLTLKDKKQGTFQMKAYRIPVPGGQNFDVNRYFALIGNDSLPVVVRYSDTDPVMKAYSDFLKK